MTTDKKKKVLEPVLEEKSRNKITSARTKSVKAIKDKNQDLNNEEAKMYTSPPRSSR
jgi:hypothetical protein